MHPVSEDIVLSSAIIKSLAKKAGFDACGIAKAENLLEDRIFISDWLKKGYQGNMSYLERNLEKRTDPSKLVPGCKSVIALLLNYYSENIQPSNAPKIARYAFSEIDYHYVIKQKLSLLEDELKANYGPQIINSTNQHSFVDSAPVLERRWAQKAGLGWIGKHTLLINPEMGSFVFIAILMIQNQVDEYDKEQPDRCGKCNKCISSCPTQALSPRVLEARKCISYLTIENKDLIPRNFNGAITNQLIGCDICQDVCPWNNKLAKIHQHKELSPNQFISNGNWNDWENLSEEIFRKSFKKSALKRAGYNKIKSNLQFINSVIKSQDPNTTL